MSSTNPLTLAPGTQIAQYEIECILGQGNMGVVYLALQRNLDRMVALKVLKPSLAQDKEFVHRFFNEARAAAALSHAHIVQAYDAGAVEPDIYYFVMEYVRGATLFDRVQAEGPIKWMEALAIAHDLAEALNHGWKRQKLVHGDIKPENVMTCPEGGIKLADFGLAKMTEHDFAGEGIMLTPLYAAPEAIRGLIRGPDCRSDIYSFGATLYHLLCGEPPFPGNDPKEVMERHLTEAVRPLSNLGLEIPKEVSDFVCTRMLAKDPAKRPQDWDEVLAAIGQLRERRSRKVAISVPVAGQHPSQRDTHGHAKLVKTGAHATVHPLPKKGKSDFPVMLVLICVVLGAAVAAGIYFASARKGVLPKKAGQGLTHEQQTAVAAWQDLRGNVQAQTDVAALAMLERYRQDYPSWQPEEFSRTLKAVRQRIESTVSNKIKPAAAKTKPVVSPLFTTPPPKPPPAPEPMPVQTAEPAAPDVVAVPKPVVPAQLSADLECRRADEAVELLQEAVTLLVRQQGGLDPLMQRTKDWLAAHPEASQDKDTVKLFMERVIPGMEEFFPKLVLEQDKLMGMPVPYAKGGTLPLRKLSAGEMILNQRNQFGEVAIRQGWTGLDRQALLTQFGLKVMGKVNQTAQEKASFLAFLLVTGQFQLATEQIRALPKGPDKEGWLLLDAVFQRLPVEGAAIRSWREVEAAWKEQRCGSVYKSLQKLKEMPTRVATRHAADIEKMLKQCNGLVPALQASSFIQQAMEKMTTNPEISLSQINCAMVRFGAADFPEKKDMLRLREKAISLLAAKALQGEVPVKWHQFAPCANPVRLPYPGASAAMYAVLRESNDLPPFIQKRMAKLYPLTLLEMGDWMGAKMLLKDSIVLDADSGVPPRLKGAILFGQTLAALRFGATDLSVQSQNRKLNDVMMTLSGEAPPGGGEMDEEARRQGKINRNRQRVFLSSLMLDSIFYGCAWEVEPTWSSLEKLVGMDPQSGAGALILSILACDLESGREKQAAGFLANLPQENDLFGAAQPFVSGIANCLRGEAGNLILPANVSPEMRERAGRLLVSVYLVRMPSMAPQDASAAAAEISEGIQPVGWLGATAWFDLLVVRVGLELGKKDYAAAQALLQRALEETSPYVSAYYPRLRFLQAGVAAASGQAGRARDFLDMVPLSPAANAGELAVASANSEKILASADSQAIFWNTWMGWSLAVKSPKPNEARVQAGKMLAAAPNLAMKRLAQALQASGTDTLAPTAVPAANALDKVM